MPDLPLNQILLGACEEMLKALPDASIDAIITDPPYGLGTREPTAADIARYLSGDALDTGGDFMGKLWEIPTVAVWKECLRVLKPGGYLLSFASTRTWDIMSIGIRAAGFENRDTISSMFSSPCLQWVHGQGFPKSLNVSKAIDKMKGAKRKVIGKKKGKGGENGNKLVRPTGNDADDAKSCGAFLVGAKQIDIEIPVTEPATDEAKKWEGYGTALKPAWEPILCFRKPIEESTVAGQVLMTGTGAMNIDAARVRHSSPEDFEKHKQQVDRIKQNGGVWNNSWKNSSDLSGAAEVTEAGRWPANVVLSHSPGCKVIETVEVEGYAINRFTDGMKPFGDGAGHPFESVKTEAERIPVYACVEGCPVAALDAQTSDLKPRSNREPSLGGGGSYGHPKMEHPFVSYGDAGGASRFFTQFLPEAPFFYTGKATKREKNQGIVVGKFHEGFLQLRDDLDDEECLLLETAMEPGGAWPEENQNPKTKHVDGSHSAIPEMAVPDALRGLFEPVKPEDNKHPCLHPDALVMTEHGYRPIGTIEVGHHVLAADGLFHLVEAVTRHPYTSPDLFEISVIGTNFKSLVTDNHPYLIWRPKRNGARIVGHDVLWVRGDSIQKGDYTMSPIVQGGLAEHEPPRPDDTEFWFLVGLYLAEGCQQQPHGNDRYPSFSLHEEETDLIDRIRAYCEPVRTSVYPRCESKGVQVIAFDADFGALCKTLCGGGAATKTIHPCVWGLPIESIESFVEGYLAGDGGQVRSCNQAKSASRDLASQMRFLAEMSGYKVEFQRYDAEPGHIGDRVFKTTSPTHVLRLTSQNKTRLKPSRPTYFEYEGVPFTLSYVKEIRRVPYVGDVVNLSVEGNHTFQTAVGMSHNTVKPVALMSWLVKLVTPKDAIVLDPFCGSGTTCAAAAEEDRKYIGIDRDRMYHKLANMRVGMIAEKAHDRRHQRDAFDAMMAMGDD